MTTKRVLIDYDEQDGPGGEPLDLAAYLVNELDNAGIVAEVFDAGMPYFGDAKRAAAEASLNGFAWVYSATEGAGWLVAVGDDLDARPEGAVIEFIDGEEQ